MPTINKNKYIFTNIDIKYENDAYDVFTEGIRFLIGKVPDSIYVKCSECYNKIKIDKNCFGPSDFILLCECKNINLASCIRANEDNFHISL